MRDCLRIINYREMLCCRGDIAYIYHLPTTMPSWQRVVFSISKKIRELYLPVILDEHYEWIAYYSSSRVGSNYCVFTTQD